MYKLDKAAQDALKKIYTQFKSASEITVSEPEYEQNIIDYLTDNELLEIIDATTLSGWVYIVRPTHEGTMAYNEILKLPWSKIDDFILQGKKIMIEEFHHETKPGRVAPDDISGPKSDQWFSEISIFNDRTLVNHPLHDQIENVCKNHRRQQSPHEKMMGYLRALAEDDEFFEKAEQRKDTTSVGINKLPSNSEQLLRELLNASNPTEYLADKFKSISDSEDDELRGIIRELKEEGYLDVLWADDLPYHVTLNNSARTYFDKASEQNRIGKSEITYIDQSIHFGDNNRISNTNIHCTENSKENNKASFANRHPIITSIIVSGIVGLIVGFILLFSFWGDIIKWIEGLFNG